MMAAPAAGPPVVGNHPRTEGTRMPDRVSPSRRDLMLAGGLGLVGLTLADQAGAAPVPPVDAGTVAGGKVQFPPWLAETERPTGGPPHPPPPPPRRRLCVLRPPPAAP